MESNSSDAGESQSILLLSGLSFIKQLVIQLESQLKQPSNSTSQLSQSIVSRLLSETDKVISLANSCGLATSPKEPALPLQSPSASPASGISESPFKCQGDNDNGNSNKRDVSKKRKTLPRWRSQVRVGSTGGVEGPLDDGHSWRKYGQKDILGARHPRGYYRCTYRNSQGCLATKQVQRTDENPTVFDVIYQGTHTCMNKSTRSGSNNNNNNNINNTVDKQTVRSSHHQDYLNSLKATLSVETGGPGSSPLNRQEDQEPNSLSFSFPSTTISSCDLATMTDNYILSRGFLPSFAISPATSESNYYSVSPSPCVVSGYEPGVGGLGFKKVDSDLTEVISSLSAATSTTNSPMGDVDVVFDGFHFDTSFQIDPCTFLA